MICALTYKGRNWVECLPIVELVVNSAVAEWTGMSPAYVMFVQHLRMPVDCLDSMHPVQAAQDQVKHWLDIKDLVLKHLL